MIKHSYEFKKKLVLEYLKNQGSYNFIAHKYGMASSSQLKDGLLLTTTSVIPD